MNAPSVLDGYFERINSVRIYPLPLVPPQSPPKVIEKFTLENLDLVPIEVEQEIKRLTELLKAVQTRENAKRGIKTREQKREEEIAVFIGTFNEKHLLALESISRRSDPPKQFRREISQICHWSCAATPGMKLENYKISIIGTHALKILRKRYPETLANYEELIKPKPARKYTKQTQATTSTPKTTPRKPRG